MKAVGRSRRTSYQRSRYGRRTCVNGCMLRLWLLVALRLMDNGHALARASHISANAVLRSTWSGAIVNAKDAHRPDLDRTTVLHLLHTFPSSKGVLLSLAVAKFTLDPRQGLWCLMRWRNIFDSISSGSIRMGTMSPKCVFVCASRASPCGASSAKMPFRRVILPAN
jgi:hypothetical protein